jgi:hypothetical protein
MNRERQGIIAARKGVADAVGAQHYRDLPLVQPRQA